MSFNLDIILFYVPSKLFVIKPRGVTNPSGKILYYPTSPETIKLLIEKAQMRVIKESSPNGNNFYLD